MFGCVHQRLIGSRSRFLAFRTPKPVTWMCHATNQPHPHSRRYLSSGTDQKEIFPKQAQIVIAGGGVVGCSVAYHLAKLGWKDIILLEQGRVSCGTTWHAAGLLGKLRYTQLESKMSEYATQLYSQLEEETGLETGLKKCGGLYVARSDDRLHYLRRLAVQSRSFGVDVEMISPDEALEKWPYMRIDDIKGALWLPEDSVINPTDLCSMIARGATNQGVRILENVRVNKVVTDGVTVQSVECSKGTINCEIFINCGGLWARDLGLKCIPNVNVPLHAVEHFYILTKSIKAHHMLPVLRDPDGAFYAREWGGGLCLGGFESNAKPCFHDSIPEHFEFQLLSEDWHQFEPLMKEMLHRVPVVESTEIISMVNGPESFTPDGKCMVGQAPNVRNYFVAAGLCSFGISFSAGIGDLLSQWITYDKPINEPNLDIQRFSRDHNNKQYLYNRVKDIVGMLYEISYPRKEVPFARPSKQSVLYGLLDEAGASWGETMGWEKPNLFAINSEDKRDFQGTFGKPNWLKNVEHECKALREGVAVVDLTSVGLFEIKSQDSSCVDLLQYLCTTNIDIPIGDVIQVSMLNHHGGYHLQCTIVRKAINRFLIVTKPALTTKTESWLHLNKFEGSDVTVDNIQSLYTILGVFGLKSRDLLESLTPSALNDDVFPHNSSREVELGYASNVTLLKTADIVDLPCFQMLIPSAHAVSLYKKIMSAGKQYNILNMGWYALDNLRVIQGSPSMGSELFPSTTPYDVAMANTIDWSKNFLGKNALHKHEDKLTKLVHLRFKHNDKDNYPWGGETIVHNDDVIGTVTSSGYNFIDGHPVCLGHLNGRQSLQEITSKDKQLTVNVAGTLYPVETINNTF